jgi:hypothetical protein
MALQAPTGAACDIRVKNSATPANAAIGDESPITERYTASAADAYRRFTMR